VTRDRFGDWRDRSRCQDQDPEVFFAARGRQSPEALAPCHGCPVRQECLTFAVESPWQPYGVWGGLPTKQVRALWRSEHPSNHRVEVEEAIGMRRDRSR
jgi:WhiB family redox-sensing transcriptional regulator